MNRRGFFATLLAPVVAPFLPKQRLMSEAKRSILFHRGQQWLQAQPCGANAIWNHSYCIQPRGHGEAHIYMTVEVMPYNLRVSGGAW